jgi:hypothetical protein
MKRVMTLMGLLCLFLNYGISQHHPEGCGMTASPESIAYLKQNLDKRANYLNQNRSNNIIWVPIQIHMTFENNGGGGLTDYEVNISLNKLNTSFYPSGVQFYECAARNSINNSTLYNFEYNVSENTLTNVYDVPNVINVYYVNTLTSSGNSLCGYAFLPGGPDHIVVDNYCAYSGQTLTHEFGHALSLYHTHGKTNGLTDELVDGSNCNVAGDDVCDTPAEPNLFGQVDGNCNYTGNQVDMNSVPFVPATNNLMSYSTWACRNTFTPGQNSRIAYSATFDRPYLNCSVAPSCATPIATFPYTESFENGLGDWRQDVNDVFDWTRQSGPTPTANTGPNSARDGNFYLFTESSAPNQIYDYAFMVSPCFDFTNFNQGELRFWYHMYGSFTGQIVLQGSTDGGFNWDIYPPFNIYGDQGNQWHEIVIDLAPYANAPFFKFRVGVQIGADFSDIAIDNFYVGQAVSPCNSFALTTSGTDITCHGLANGNALAQISGGTSPYAFNWSNGSTDDQIINLSSGIYSVTVFDDNLCSATSQVNIVEPLPMSVELSASNTASSSSSDGSVSFAYIAGGNQPFSYQWSTGDISSSIVNRPNGNYSLSVTDANGCVAQNRIFLSAPQACTGTKTNWEYTNAVENGLGLFKQNADDDRNWNKRSGNTPTSGTGPSGAHAGTYYRYVESSGNNNNPGKISAITTKKCLDFTSLNQPTFTFWYHMNGNTMGSLDVQISYDGGDTWRGSIWSREGDQGLNWQKAVIDLSLYPSTQKRLRLVGTTGNGSSSDIALDLYSFVEVVNADQVWQASESADMTTIEQFDVLKTYPNPASDEMNFEIETPLNGEAVIQFISVTGQIMKKEEIELIHGMNNIHVNTTNLNDGLYFVQILFGGVSKSTTIIISH